MALIKSDFILWCFLRAVNAAVKAGRGTGCTGAALTTTFMGITHRDGAALLLLSACIGTPNKRSIPAKHTHTTGVLNVLFKWFRFGCLFSDPSSTLSYAEIATKLP